MKLAFTKMHGLGNDFVVVDATRAPFEPSPALLGRLTDRRYGVGCDQVLVVQPPSSADVDFDYRIFNADGSEVGQCGNGARALARFVAARGLSDKPELRVRTRTSTLRLQLIGAHDVSVDMGVPRLAPADVPLQVPARRPLYEARLADGRNVAFAALSMGNPHAVIAVDDVARAPVGELGPAVQACGLFPQGVNVGFLQIEQRTAVSLRVFERGSGETLACGSGACAAVVAGRLWGRLDARVRVRLPGGELRIDWDGEGAPVIMTGPAEFVFTGEMEWPS